MRSSHSSTTPVASSHHDWRTVRLLLPYLLRYKGRVAIALAFLVGAKLANVGVPLILKRVVDALTVSPAHPLKVAAIPLAMLIAYGLLRLSTTLFTELREFIFARVTQNAIRTIALEVFQHLHALSMRFHLERQTGGISRDIERGTRAVSSLISYALFSILPTLVEIVLVLVYLGWHYDVWFALITLGALVSYIVFTVTVTDWRTHFRRSMNELDSQANSRAIDSLMNVETVKYFGNAQFEAERYDVGLRLYQSAAIKSQTSLSLLNSGQSLIIAIAVTLILWRATAGVIAGTMTLGDLVLVNAFMIQLYIPLNFLGVIYRELKQGLADMERLFSLLQADREVADAPDAIVLTPSGAEVTFSHVGFGYNPNRVTLTDIDFTIAAGSTTAVVGHSGSGKSTLTRLLFRFYDVNSGTILIDGHDVRQLTQNSLRQAIGIVPQDTVLFNDTIGYNIGYGRAGASQIEIESAARAAHIHDFVASLPDGYGTQVGERGLKLSGGEKQRVAIARAILKDPAILVFDEATSALDSAAEQIIQSQLKDIARYRTTLVIAHRLSTIVDADQILVMEGGRIVERGHHHELLQKNGHYARMWQRQQQAKALQEEPAPS